jgi:AcrR family transcriptional regulator
VQRRRQAGPRKGEIRERHILDAAERLLSTTPFVDITMDDIAGQAGLSRSSLYFYFRSKEAVLGALHERMHALMRQPTELLEDADAPFEDAMRRTIELTARNWRTHAPALRTFHEVAMVSPEFGEQWRSRLGEYVDQLTGLIEREREQGRAAPAPPSARAISSAWFWMIEHEFYTLNSRKHTKAEERELVDTLTIILFRSIGAA